MQRKGDWLMQWMRRLEPQIWQINSGHPHVIWLIGMVSGRMDTCSYRWLLFVMKDIRMPCLEKRKRRHFYFLVYTGRECVGTQRENTNDFLNQPWEPHHSLKNVSDKLYYSPGIAKYLMTFHHKFTIKFYHHKFIIINVLSFNTMYKN